jgi:hypothetical protein
MSQEFHAQVDIDNNFGLEVYLRRSGKAGFCFNPLRFNKIGEKL